MVDPVSFHDGKVLLYPGDCLEVLDRLPENSIDAVVCDPPYHLQSIVKRFGSDNAAPAQYGTDGAYARASSGFMSCKWDGGDIAFRVETWAKVLRVMKPGGHLLAFSACRTYHRMACAIEDAGFEIREMHGWLFGTGFPKSHNISLAIDKMSGASPRGKSFNMKVGGDRDKEFEDNGREFLPPYEGATDAARQWQGWGTATKPAMEPICLARKPLSEKNVAANVLHWGTGALNIDATRVGTTVETWPTSRSYIAGRKHPNGETKGATESTGVAPSGRWPPNICHDGSDEVLALFPETERSKASARGNLCDIRGGNYNQSRSAIENSNSVRGHSDMGGSTARFFYHAKASKADRVSSKHPTVKPINLMRWLIKLVTPVEATVLDPFAGTGTTGHAALLDGRRAILIEREAQYQADIAHRMHVALAGEVELSVIEADKNEDDAPGPLFASLK